MRPMSLLHRWIWRDAERRAHKLLSFAETEADGGRDLVRAAELTSDPTLRRLYLLHARDEERHANLFRRRGTMLLRSLSARSFPVLQLDWISPGERGLDDLCVERESDASLLAFLHLSEKAATRQFATYRDVTGRDPKTSEVFAEILRDETFHMNYTLSQLRRIAPGRRPMLLWRARSGRLWKGYLRLMSAIAGAIGTLILTMQYFALLPPFALLAKRAAKKDPCGWTPVPAGRDRLESQY